MAKLKKKIALIFGITGQDGSYLAELLIKKNYIIHGVKRRSSSANTERIDHLFDSVNFTNKSIFIHYGDISDGTSSIETDVLLIFLSYEYTTFCWVTLLKL